VGKVVKKEEKREGVKKKNTGRTIFENQIKYFEGPFRGKVQPSSPETRYPEGSATCGARNLQIFFVLLQKHTFFLCLLQFCRNQRLGRCYGQFF
jgi:hypothetical protein